MMPSQLDSFRQSLADRAQKPLSIAIGSGKGGVGKSSLAISMAAVWAHQGQRVRLIDADAGLADLNIFLGINPEWHWGHVLRGEKTFAEAMVRDVVPCMDFLHGFSGVTDPSHMQGDAAKKLIEGIQAEPFEYPWTIYDVGAGLAEPNLVFMTSVDLVVLVLSPELTSLADAYGTLKTILKRKREQKVVVLVNQAESVEQARVVYLNLVKIAAQFLGVRIPFLGWLPKDPEVPRALAKQKPLVLQNAASPYAQAVVRINKALSDFLRGQGAV